MPNTIPSDAHGAGDSGHVTDHNNIADMLTLLTAVNVKNTAYSGGATGNGSTDDTTAIQAAITAAKSSGRAVYFPAGTYIVSSSLLVGGGSPGALVIRGEGWNSQIKLANSANCYIFDFGSSGSPQYTPGLKIADLYLNCNGANQSSSSGGVYARGSANCHFHHIWVDQPYEAGIRTYQDGLGNYGHHTTIDGRSLFTNGYVSGGLGLALKLEQCDENTITGCTFQDCGTGTYPSCQVYDTSAGLQSFEGCSFVTTRSTGVSMLKTDSSPSRVKISGCNFDSSTTGHLLELGGDQCSVLASDFLNFGSTGNYAIHMPNAYTKVIGNNFVASGTTGRAVFEDGGSHNLVIGNTATGTYASGAAYSGGGTGTVLANNIG